jgi:hypothetical protein
LSDDDRFGGFILWKVGVNHRDWTSVPRLATAYGDDPRLFYIGGE